MNKLLLFLFLFPSLAFSQASVAYYPFNSLGTFSVSTNPNRLVWGDARFQTNSILASLSTTLCPLVNVSRTERTNWYVGPGFRFNWLNNLNGSSIFEGYSLHAGVRVAPVESLPNLRVAFELSPSISTRNSSVSSGVFYSYLGVAYQFKKRQE